MKISFELAPLVAVFLLSLRLGVLIVAGPVFSGLARMTTQRVLFTVALSVVLVWGLAVPLGRIPLTLGGLATAALTELALGVTLGFGVFAAFGVFSLAGKMVDIQSGFGLASVFDPVTRASSPIFSQMLNLLALTIFFALDGHHAFLRGVAFSLQQWPPGSYLQAKPDGTGTLLPLVPVLRQFGLMFSLALSLVAPVLFALFLVDAALALISRVLPQMNILVIGVPIKVVVGFVIFALALAVFLPVMGKIFATVFTFWEQVAS
jgi:flagellar biosynthetic protein FliR